MERDCWKSVQRDDHRETGVCVCMYVCAESDGSCDYESLMRVISAVMTEKSSLGVSVQSVTAHTHTERERERRAEGESEEREEETR